VIRTLAAIGVLAAALSVQDMDVAIVTRTAVERTLTSGEQHTYKLPLRAGEVATLVVEQRGIDVSVRCLDPEGRLLAEVQNDYRRNGEERPTIAAAATGTYSLVIRAPYQGQGNGGYTIRIADIRPATDDDRSLQDAATHYSEGTGLDDAGKFEEAEAQFRQALEIVERVKGSDDVTTATIVASLASCLVDRRRFAEAEPLFDRALPILESKLGSDDPVTLRTRTRQGRMYMFSGQRVNAERAIQRSLPLLEQSLGLNHPFVAESLTVLGIVSHEAGDFEQAQVLDRRALAILEAASATDTVEYADVTNNLGILYLDKGDYTRAEEWLRRALGLGERLRGPDSNWVATTVNNLGIIARRQGKYDEAERDYGRALTIQEKVLGPDHPDVATDLNNLAIVYSNKGDTARALETHMRALRIREQSTGAYSNATLASLGNLARTYARVGDIPHAIEYQQRTEVVLEKQLSLNAAVGSERQKLAFVSSVSDRTDRTISLHLDLAPQSRDASALAVLVILQRKGRVLDAMADLLASVQSRSASPEDQRLLDELRATTSQIAARVLNGPAGGLSREEQQKVKDLEARREQIEASLSDHNLDFRGVSREVTLESVQAAIPARTALVEYAVYRPFDPTAANNDVAYGPPHYAVYVITGSGEPRGKDLGPAGPIDTAIRALRDALPDPHRADVSRLARAVDARVLQPIRDMLGNPTRLLISPDGALNLIPFESLVDPAGKFAVERYGISYLSSGRDLLRMEFSRGESAKAIIVANPLFGDPDAKRSVSAARSVSSARRSVTAGAELSDLYFAPLTGTGEEARAIHALVLDATVLTRTDATKPAITQLTGPRILHIATHGFFLEAASSRATTTSVNPLLRSGLALAGANLDKGRSVLTAFEASHLNLWGTRLVTLSACDTGLGEVRNGEGVYGLRRSFFLAGAETVVMSLWPVSDYVTRQMMTAYYRGLKDGLGRGEALRRAQLSVLAQSNRRHPFYWASFIQAGDWRPINP
jgi:CHAT domain-containing protein/Tfp pilus assembly protein PilF